MASTQDRKNKDIAEGGSKGNKMIVLDVIKNTGTVLLDVNRQDSPFEAFTKYIDAILDVLLVDKEKQIKDRYGKEEILFMGPGIRLFIWVLINGR